MSRYKFLSSETKPKIWFEQNQLIFSPKAHTLREAFLLKIKGVNLSQIYPKIWIIVPLKTLLMSNLWSILCLFNAKFHVKWLMQIRTGLLHPPLEQCLRNDNFDEGDFPHKICQKIWQRLGDRKYLFSLLRRSRTKSEICKNCDFCWELPSRCLLLFVT